MLRIWCLAPGDSKVSPLQLGVHLETQRTSFLLAQQQPKTAALLIKSLVFGESSEGKAAGRVRLLHPSQTDVFQRLVLR